LVAVVVAAGPYLGRPTRRLGQLLVGLGALSALYLGTAFPKDLFGGIVLGWGVAATVHLLFGSPGGRPTSRQLAIALPQVGIYASHIRLASEQSPDATIFECVDVDGPLVVKVIGRDEVDSQVLSKAWRFLAYKEPVPPFFVSRVQQVEHEACMALLAGSAGVRVPQVMYVGRAGPNAAILAERSVSGLRLAELEAAAVTDDLLRALWHEVATLHGSQIAHGALDASNVFLADGEPVLVSFAHASTVGFEHRGPKDVAELLAATAAIVGNRRAVAACASVLGEAPLLAAIPFLQPAALRHVTRSALRGRYQDVQQGLDDLRRSAAEAGGVEAPAVAQLQRFRASSVVLAASSLVAIGVLLDQIGDPGQVWDAARRAQWGWVVAALAISLATNIPYAVALMGTLPLRLPLWPTAELQLGMSYSNLAIPMVGGTGFQIRFLQRQGADLPTAIVAGGIISTAGALVTQLPLLALALWLTPDNLHLGKIPVRGIIKFVLIAVLAAGFVAAVGFGVPRLRRFMLRPVKEAWGTTWAVLRSRRLLSLIVGGNLVVNLLYAFCLLCCLRAFGATLSFWTLLALSIVLGTIVALIPLPGGATAVGSVGMAGALAALGVSSEAAVAATIVNQLTVSYIPALPGWFATRHLLLHEYL
jgi:undecaprenyl-diphosphatase